MRERLLGRLGERFDGSLDTDQFLVYLMSPYKEFQLDDLLPEGTTPEEVNVDFAEWDDEEGEYTEQEVLDQLTWLRDELRTGPDVNAFIALDPDISIEEMDPATQSIEFARASNVVVFVAPHVGRNLGVGIETGSVLEAFYADDETDPVSASRQERVLFVHEDSLSSAMIGSVTRRWETTVRSYTDREELLHEIKLFVVDVMNREFAGDLPQLAESG